MLAEKITTVCGSTIFVKVKLVRDVIKGQKRKTKANPTPEKVEAVNRRNSERELAMLLNYNFKPGDLHLVLTYSNIPSNDEAHKALERFIRKVREYLRKLGKEFRAVVATEYKHSRIHHHVVCSGIDIDVLTKIWSQGFVKLSVLDSSGDYRKLAAYLIKETSKTFKDPDAFSRRRYNTTRSVIRPEQKSEKVSVVMLLDDPKPIKDYYIDQDSVYRGTNPFDEKPYIEYVLVSNDAETPRLNVWRRGKILKRREPKYNGWLKKNINKQAEIDINFLK